MIEARITARWFVWSRQDDLVVQILTLSFHQRMGLHQKGVKAAQAFRSGGDCCAVPSLDSNANLIEQFFSQGFRVRQYVRALVCFHFIICVVMCRLVMCSAVSTHFSQNASACRVCPEKKVSFLPSCPPEP